MNGFLYGLKRYNMAMSELGDTGSQILLPLDWASSFTPFPLFMLI